MLDIDLFTTKQTWEKYKDKLKTVPNFYFQVHGFEKGLVSASDKMFKQRTFFQVYNCHKTT